jgi:hypothetical protein
MKYLLVAGAVIVVIAVTIGTTVYNIESDRLTNAMAIACVQNGGDFVSNWEHSTCTHSDHAAEKR